MYLSTQQLPKRAESPTINSVGQRPTKRHARTKPEPQRGVIIISPFQGLNCRSDSSHRALPYANDFGLSAHHSEKHNTFSFCWCQQNDIPTTL